MAATTAVRCAGGWCVRVSTWTIARWEGQKGAGGCAGNAWSVEGRRGGGGWSRVVGRLRSFCFLFMSRVRWWVYSRGRCPAPFFWFVFCVALAWVSGGGGGVWTWDCVDRGRGSASSVWQAGPAAPTRGDAGLLAHLRFFFMSAFPLTRRLSAVPDLTPVGLCPPAPRALPCGSRHPSGGPPPHATPTAGATAAHAIPAVPLPALPTDPGQARASARAPPRTALAHCSPWGAAPSAIPERPAPGEPLITPLPFLDRRRGGEALTPCPPLAPPTTEC